MFFTVDFCLWWLHAPNHMSINNNATHFIYKFTQYENHLFCFAIIFKNNALQILSITYSLLHLRRLIFPGTPVYLLFDLANPLCLYNFCLCIVVYYLSQYQNYYP